MAKGSNKEEEEKENVFTKKKKKKNFFFPLSCKIVYGRGGASWFEFLSN